MKFLREFTKDEVDSRLNELERLIGKTGTSSVVTRLVSGQLVLYGTGAPPSATGLPNGTIYIMYTP